MADGAGSFVSKLIRPANEATKLTPYEISRLLQRTASAIQDYRDQIACSGAPVNDHGQDDIVFDLNAMAASVDLLPPEKISAMLLTAAQVIRACKILLEKKR